MKSSQNKTAARRKREQKERRQAIIEVAKEVFFEKGFLGTTMDEIANGCELAKGTLYLYFKSKEELYVTIMVEGLALLKNDFEKIPGLSLPPEELLGEVLQSYYNFYEKNSKYFRIMFLGSQPDLRERVNEELLAECMAGAQECMQVLSGVIEKGIKACVFRKVNAWAFANVLWSAVNGIVMLYEQGSFYRDEVLGLSLQEMLQNALDLALNGLRLV